MVGMGSTRPKAIVLTWAPLPTTKLLTTAFLKSPLAADDGHQIHELNSTPDSSLKDILSSDGMLICAGSLARVAHLLGPNQKRFFDVTEDSFLFRTLVGESYPEYICHKSSDPWAVKLDWGGGRRKYVIKPNVGYSSIDTFIVNNAEEQEELRTLITPSDREFIIEEFIDGEFLCSDIVVDDKSILVTSVYKRHDYGIKETMQYHASELYRQHAQKFKTLVREVIAQHLPLPPDVRVMFNVEAKLGDDSILRIVEINPFRACGVAPLATSLIFNKNVFELAFAEKLDSEVSPPTNSDREIVVCLARKEGEKATDLLPPLLNNLREADGVGREAVELQVILEEKDKEVFEIHDGRIFELVKKRNVL
ncbi:hypothetical protein TrST_g6155 [Triparma strigata]|uniref:ATP-grasp domain-containing protein n=1 Tax=Triparma strigata TaxID=1606541 RepID=A0A9W7ESB1_9STRA|nr:hypothetical protein TrST_g6155 [Triparma strigata]